MHRTRGAEESLLALGRDATGFIRIISRLKCLCGELSLFAGDARGASYGKAPVISSFASLGLFLCKTMAFSAGSAPWHWGVGCMHTHTGSAKRQAFVQQENCKDRNPRALKISDNRMILPITAGEECCHREQLMEMEG